MPNGVQTNEDIPEIPEGIEVSDSTGSDAPDVEPVEDINYESEGA